MAPEPGQKPSRPSQPPSIQEDNEDEAGSPATLRPSPAARQNSAPDQPRQYGKIVPLPGHGHVTMLTMLRHLDTFRLQHRPTTKPLIESPEYPHSLSYTT